MKVTYGSKVILAASGARAVLLPQHIVSLLEFLTPSYTRVLCTVKNYVSIVKTEPAVKKGVPCFTTDIKEAFCCAVFTDALETLSPDILTY